MNKVYSKDSLGLLLNTAAEYTFFNGINCGEHIGRNTFSGFNNNTMHKEVLTMLKEGFYSNLGHELRTPLNVLLASAQLIEHKLSKINNDEFSMVLKNEVTNIKLNSFRLLKLSNNFIDLAEIHAKNFFLKYDNYNIVEWIESLCEDINRYLNEFLSSKDMTIIFDTSKEEIMLSFDKAIIDRILLNLISNSIKFNRNNSDIYVKISVNEKHVIISVKDYGIGISKKDIQSIFYGLSYNENQMTKPAEGCGLGLEITKNLVQMHGGEIEVKSTLNIGTEVKIKLPFLKNENDVSSYISSKVLYNRQYRIKMELSDIYDYEG